MKTLINFFNPLLFSFINLIYSKKVLKDFTLALFVSLLFIPSSLSAAAATSCSNTATNAITIGETIISDKPVNNSDAYHQIIIPSTGTLTIVYQGTNDDVTFYVGTSCTDDNTIYNNTDGDGVTHTVPSFSVSKDDMIYIKITNIGNNENYSLTFNLTAVTNVPPTADAAATPTNTTVGDTITFDGNGSNDSDGTIDSYEWTEGTTTLSTLASFTKSDLTVGVHTITLTVTDDDGDTDTDTVTITVNTIPPIADAGADQNVTEGDTVTLDGTGSSDADGTIASYVWTEGVTTLSTLSSFSKSDFAIGTHTVTLTVTDNHGATDTDTVVINVSGATNNTPTVSISPDTVSIPEGITSTDLQITLDEAPSTGDLNVTYTNSYDNSTGYLTILQGVSTSTLTIDTSSMTQGEEFNITLTGATGISGQNNGIVSTDNNFSTISIGEPVVDLSIAKIDSADPVDAGTSFDYTITIYNKGTETATNISVTDTLPSGLAINLTTSNSDSTDWNCTRSGDVLTCLHDGNISTGVTKTIVLHATAPSTAGTITNNVSVSSDSDYDTSNNSASESTSIVAVGYQEIDEANELCYSDITPQTFASYDTDCEKVGNFYYGDGCTATVMIKADDNLTGNLTDVNITKMIAVSNNKDLDDGGCTASQGNCTGPNPFAPDFSPSYLEAYMVPDVGTMIPDSNMTITDTNTHNKKELYQIAIYATYSYDGVYHFGRVYDCTGLGEGGVILESTGDVIDTVITASNAATYNASTDTSSNGLKYIQTMAAASERSLTGVHLDIATNNATPYIFDGDPDLYSDFVIIPYLVNTDENGECGSDFEFLYDTAGNELVIPVEEGEYSGTKTITVPSDVRRDARLQLIIVDPNLLSETGQGCLATSSTSGNLEGIGQCGNSEGQYIAGYTVDAWDRCGINNGQPCLSSNGGYSGGGDPTYPGYNPIYDNVLGCYMCTFDIQPACTSDNFAIRPDKFDMGMSDTDAPHLLRAGEDYGVSLTARDAVNNIPAAYTVTDHNFNNDLDTNTTRYFKDGSVDTNNLLHGTSDLNRSTTAYMVAGLSSLSTTQPANAEEIVQVSYDDVGLIGLKVYDTIWAEIDNDDTPMDCNSSTHTYICGESNVTFIPHHFTLNNIHLRDHRDGNFTYLSNDLNMSTHLDVNISAMNADEVITQNFQQGSLYYENPVSVDINVTEWNATIVPSTRHPKGNLVHKHDIPTETLLGFGGSDANGTHLIPWDEANTTQQLMFNYTRQNNQTVNPFKLNGTDVNITVRSTYTDLTGLTPSSPTLIDGSGIADRNVTFYFARAKSSQFFYDDVINSVQTPISIVIYCDTYPTCSELNNEIKINEPYWWLSVDHNETIGDGNIVLDSPPTEIPAGAGNPTITPDTDITITPDQPGVDTDVYVNSGANPSLPMIAEIFLDTTTTNTNSWLIYNTASDILDPDPFYKVRFIGTSGWAGHGKTGHVVDSNTSFKKNRRLGW